MGLADHFRQDAELFDAQEAPLYGRLTRGMADDLDAGGVVADLTAPWADRPRGDVVHLRLLGALHRVVLRREAPLLALHYRSVGGTADPGGAWPLARAVLRERREELRAELEVAPQTNETGRAAALVVGLLHACAAHGLRRVRLLELGASAGLNLRVAHFAVGGGGWAWGPAHSAVDLRDAVVGELPAPSADVARAGVEVVSARGCDLAPVDPLHRDGRLRLTSFVWPDHVERHERLRGALAVAAKVPADVDAAPAQDWLPRRLAEAAGDDVLTVVWHSVVRQYVPPQDWAQVLDALQEGRARGPLAHVSLESASAPYTSAPRLVVDGVELGEAPAHGVPLTLLP